MKAIRYNAPTRSAKKAFGDSENYTLHAGGITVYFDLLEEVGGGYYIVNEGERVGWIAEDETDISPQVAKKKAHENPNEKIPFADE